MATGATSNCLWNRRDGRVFDLREVFFYLTPTFSSGSLSTSLSVLSSSQERNPSPRSEGAPDRSVLSPGTICTAKIQQQSRAFYWGFKAPGAWVTSRGVSGWREGGERERGGGGGGGFDTTTYWRFNPSERGSDASLGPSWALWDFFFLKEWRISAFHFLPFYASVGIALGFKVGFLFSFFFFFFPESRRR